MKRSQLMFLLGLLSCAGYSHAQVLDTSRWTLVWQDEFDGSVINQTYWSRCERGKADWNNTKSLAPELVEVSNGTLKLKGIVNINEQDPAPYLTAGIHSKGKFSFTYGKVQIRARFKSAQGAWPALWMLGGTGQWPHNGEIDLMEHLNFDQKVYQTLHSGFTQSTPYDVEKHPKKGSTSQIDRDAWNTYGCEWDAEQVVFTVNGESTHHYPRRPDLGSEQYPFVQPFYILFTMQIGGKWVNASGATDPEDFPAYLEVDWVRVYKEASE